METINSREKISRSVAASRREKTNNKKKNRRFLFSGLFFGLLFFIGVDASSQSSLDSLIRNVSENSKSLISARQFYEAEIIGARTGNSPANPEIEYAYLWGTPESTGDRIDFGVTQTFDFPTAYSSRSKLSKINQEQANLRLQLTEQDVMVSIRKLWINAVFLNQKMIVLNKRLENTQFIANAVKRLYEEGEANQMDLNQAILKVTSLSNEMYRLNAEIIANDAEISRLNGGAPFSINDSTFPKHSVIVLDTLVRMYLYGPRNSAFQGEVMRTEQQKEVVFNQKLPKLKAGYYQETILGTKLLGFRAGITIPLWENAHAVKSAKANVVFAQSDAMRFWEQQELTIGRMFGEYQILISQVEEMEKLLTTVNSDALLLKALDGGEISLTQYYYESDFFFQNQLDFIELNRDLHFVEAELMRVSY